MFRVSQHPSSGVSKTVHAASGTGHNTCTATPIQRDLIGTQFSNTTARALAYHSRAVASVESKMATLQHKVFCVREFIETAVQRAFRLRFNIQPPTTKNFCHWNHQFEQTDCLCKGKSSGQPHVSEENVR